MNDLTVTNNPLLIVLSGPSGVGKDAVLNKMKSVCQNFHFTVTATTRPKRTGEMDGRDYIFLSRDNFEEKLKTGAFIEWAEVYGNLYGVPKAQVTSALNDGLNVVIKIDVQGARTIKTLAPQATFIFLLPPSLNVLEKRLRDRMTESPNDLRRRLDIAKSELTESDWFDFSIINKDDEIEDVVDQIIRICADIQSESKSIKYFPD